MAISCDNDDLKDCKADPDCEYFTCKVNGEEWSTNCERDPLFACSAIDVQYYKDISGFSLVAVNGNKKETVFLEVYSKLKLGSNKYFINNSVATKYTNGNKEVNCRKFRLDTLISNDLFLTKIDTINFELEGTFFLECKNECNETVKITDGEFRVKYRF